MATKREQYVNDVRLREEAGVEKLRITARNTRDPLQRVAADRRANEAARHATNKIAHAWSDPLKR